MITSYSPELKGNITVALDKNNYIREIEEMLKNSIIYISKKRSDEEPLLAASGRYLQDGKIRNLFLPLLIES